jgi:O-succinylhomoserine sulfhydrylase
MKDLDFKKLQTSTKLVRGGTKRSNFGETSEAIFMNSGFCYDTAETAESRFNGVAPSYVYSRYSNPSLRMLEEKLIMIEKGAEECSVMASGMAAVFASIMCDIKPGDHLVASRVLFGSCHYIINTILPRLNVKITLVDCTDEAAWQAAFEVTPTNPKPTHVFIETPANPTTKLVDIAFVAGLSKKAGARFIVDNIFASPLLQSPLALGADVVVYSTTKHMDGQGRTLGGAVLGSEQYIKDILLPFNRHTGPALSPFNAWVVLKALETMDLRMEKHCANAQKVAELLEGHAKIEQVLFPGLKSHPDYALAQKQMVNGGTILAFIPKATKELSYKQAAFALMNKLEIIDISNNIGDAKSLITHPATTTHSNIPEVERIALGISDGLLRLSVGLENADDLINDLKQALS